MESSAEEHKKKGNEAFKNADWDLAIKEYNKAISLDNKQPAYFSNRAACWSYKGNHESALADASRCLEIDPAYVKGYSRKGKALFDLSRLDEAKEAYQAGLAVDATNQGCTQGLADVKAARARASSGTSSTGSSFGSAFSNFSASGWLQKLKQAGIGGRLQMYMVAFAGYYVYKNFMANPKSPETETEKPTSEPDAEVRYSARATGVSLQRGFDKVQGRWSSFLESREGEHSLVFLHRTASSAEAEFAKVMPAVQKAFGSPVSLFAPDRPCHGYSPCEGATGEVKWLQGLLKSRQAQHMAYIASGKEAVQTILSLLRERQESAPVLFISPGVAADKPKPAEFQQWLKRQRQSPRALADAVRWAASVLESETQAEDEATGSPEGCSITVLTEAGETEDKVFLEELEGQGHVVRSRQLSPEDSLKEEVAKEASQLLA